MKDRSMNNIADSWLWECLVGMWVGQIFVSAIIFESFPTLLCCSFHPHCEDRNNPTAWL